eukprot:5174794-Pleurochrysis_carterae.AAC.2
MAVPPQFTGQSLKAKSRSRMTSGSAAAWRTHAVTEGAFRPSRHHGMPPSRRCRAASALRATATLTEVVS